MPVATMEMEYNLFKGFTDLKLPVEVCLKIVEDTVDIDPKNAQVLMCLSKDFCSLVKRYERSITKTLAVDQSINYNIRPSLASRENVNYSPFSYPWLLEIRSRDTIINFLVQYDLTDLGMLGGTGALPSNIPALKQQFHTDRIRKDMLLLMYQLVDSTAGWKKKDSIRMSQIEFLEMLSTLELATLAYFIEALSLGYARYIGLQPDRMTEQCMLEHICVFKDKALQYGPFFVWAAMAGTEKALMWSRVSMQEGISDMQAFERGESLVYASLQSAVWKLFCKRAGCNLADIWTVMKGVIDRQLDHHSDEA